MIKKYYLGLDNGTTGTTALLLDETWKQVGRGYKELTQHYPQDGWVEQDALEIWESILYSTSVACETAGILPEQISCLGLDNSGETVVLWDKFTGLPVYNAIVWQDRRTARYCDSLKEQYGEYVKQHTGVMIDSYFSATKIKWIIDNVEGVKEKIAAGRILASTLDGWIFWKMTHGSLFITDASTASRTLLMDVHKGQWDDGLLELFGVRRSMLPEIRDSSAIFGYTDPLEFLGARIPIAGACVDQQSSLFGQACFEPGMTKCTYGTGCFMLMNTGSNLVESSHGILPTVAWRLGGKISYALDGGVYVTGAATQWLRDKLRIIGTAAEAEIMAFEAKDNGGVYFVPAFFGLAAPHWDSYARGVMIGVTGGTSREHIVRATLEATAYQVKDISFDGSEADRKKFFTRYHSYIDGTEPKGISTLYACGEGSEIPSWKEFSHPEGIAVGRETHIHKTAMCRLVMPNFAGKPRIIVGDHCEIGAGSTLAAVNRIVLENTVRVAENVHIKDYVYDDSFHSKTVQSSRQRAASRLSAVCASKRTC